MLNVNKSYKKRRAEELAKGTVFIGHGYMFKEELDLDKLQTTFKNHRRLGVFAEKGCTCVRCNRVGTRLVIGEEFNGNLHVDLYTNDLILMTIDHIHPKSKGGSDDMTNLDPMCGPCNWAKGSKIV